MGYKRSYDVAEAAKHINSACYESSSVYNDGFVAWGAKQDLYRLKWILEDALARCPKFSPEDKWLEEQEKERQRKFVMKVLKDEV